MKTQIETYVFVLALAAALGTVTAAAAQPVSHELPGWVALESARDYEVRARYPESSRALAVGEVDPVRAKRVPAPHSLNTPGVDGLLTVWSSEVSFEAGAPVVLHVAVTGLPPQDLARTRVTGEVFDAAGNSIGAVHYRDGGWRDEARGDGTFTGVFRFPVERTPQLAESFLVKVTAETPNGEILRAASGFLLSNPHAQLTGRYRDELVDGDLVISAEVEVAQAGRFHLAGTLYSASGEPVGWAQAAAKLEAGTHFIPLSYFGLMFTERKVTGPFHLGSLALSTTSGMPNALNDLVENAHTTRAYPAAAFRAEPYGDPALLDAARRLEADAVFSRIRADQ